MFEVVSKESPKVEPGLGKLRFGSKGVFPDEHTTAIEIYRSPMFLTFGAFECGLNRLMVSAKMGAQQDHNGVVAQELVEVVVQEEQNIEFASEWVIDSIESKSMANWQWLTPRARDKVLSGHQQISHDQN